MLPLRQDILKVLWEFGIKAVSFLGDWVNKSQGFGVQRLAGNDLETIFNKLFVLGKHGPLHHLIAAIQDIVKDGVAEVFHVCPDLMRSSGFKFAFNQGNIAAVF